MIRSLRLLPPMSIDWSPSHSMNTDANRANVESTSGQIVSKLAQDAKRRDEITQREAQREQPAYILDVEQSEVGYTIPPRFLPLSHVDYAAFTALMQERWALVPDLSHVRIDPTALTNVSPEDVEQQVFKHLAKGGRGNIEFGSGRYAISPTEFVPIVRVSINYESVLVGVAGIGRVAEAVAQDVYEALCASAGVSRSWSEVQKEVQQVGYGTRTRVDLGSTDAFEKMLSPAVRSFIDTRMLNGERYAAHSGTYHRRDALKAPANAVLSVALDDIVFRLARFNPETGMAIQTDLRLTVTSRGDYHSGIVSVISELPYEIHVQWVGELIELVGSPD